MEITAPYTIEHADGKLVITIPQGLVREEEVRRLLAYLTIESVRSKSVLTQEQADELAQEVDAAVWKRVSASYPP